MSKVTPFADRVIIKRTKSPDKTRGGIILPDVAKKQISEGKILSVGDVKNPQLVQEGAIVIFPHYMGNDFEIDGEEFLALREIDILAVLV